MSRRRELSGIARLQLKEQPSLQIADQVYVSGLADDVTEEDLAAHFGSIGMLKEDKKRGKPKIWLYRDKATNALKVCYL